MLPRTSPLQILLPRVKCLAFSLRLSSLSAPYSIRCLLCSCGFSVPFCTGSFLSFFKIGSIRWDKLFFLSPYRNPLPFTIKPRSVPVLPYLPFILQSYWTRPSASLLLNSCPTKVPKPPNYQTQWAPHGVLMRLLSNISTLGAPLSATVFFSQDSLLILFIQILYKLCFEQLLDSPLPPGTLPRLHAGTLYLQRSLSSTGGRLATSLQSPLPRARPLCSASICTWPRTCASYSSVPCFTHLLLFLLFVRDLSSGLDHLSAAFLQQLSCAPCLWSNDNQYFAVQI